MKDQKVRDLIAELESAYRDGYAFGESERRQGTEPRSAAPLGRRTVADGMIWQMGYADGLNDRPRRRVFPDGWDER